MAGHSLVLLDWATPDGVTPVVAGAVFIDATVNEQHVVTSEVTTHKVERGSDVADYIRPMPRKLTLEIVITDHPIASTLPSVPMDPYGSSTNTPKPYPPGGLAKAEFHVQPSLGFSNPSYLISVGGQPTSYSALAFSSEFHQVRECYGDLVAAVLSGCLFRVTTTLRVYEADDHSRCMALVNFAVPRNAEKGNALQGTVDFQEVVLVSTSTVAVGSKQAKKRNGPKSTKDATDPEQAQIQSVLFKATR